MKAKPGVPAKPVKARAVDMAKAGGLEDTLRGQAWWSGRRRKVTPKQPSAVYVHREGESPSPPEYSTTPEPTRTSQQSAAPGPRTSGVGGREGEAGHPKGASRTGSSTTPGQPEVWAMYAVPQPRRVRPRSQGSGAQGAGAAGSLPIPDWIQDDTVDSQAMLSAFIHYLGQCSEEEKVVMQSRVYMISHAESEFVNVGGMILRPKKVPPPVPSKPCVERGCRRCQMKEGGFKFKWFANQWLEDYLDLKRPGPWVPPIIRIGPDPRGTGQFLREGGGIWSDSSDSD